MYTRSDALIYESLLIDLSNQVKKQLDALNKFLSVLQIAHEAANRQHSLKMLMEVARHVDIISQGIRESKKRYKATPEMKIATFIRKHPGSTSKKIAQMLKISDGKVRNSKAWRGRTIIAGGAADALRRILGDDHFEYVTSHGMRYGRRLVKDPVKIMQYLRKVDREQARLAAL